MSKVWRWHVLDQIVKDNDYKEGAELGVKDGRTSFYLLEQNPELKMHMIDAWTVMPTRNDEGSETYIDWPLDKLFGDVKAEAKKYRGRAVVYKSTTELASKLFPDHCLDFVFIDADHSYPGVKNDIEHWLPKVRSGGMVLGHDIHWPSVEKAVKEQFDSWMTYENHVWGVTIP